MTEVPTTPRRSKRFQPTVFANASSLVSRSSSTDTWTDELKPLHSRPTTADDLFEPDEIDLGTTQENEEDSKKGREEREVEYQTRFYQSFTRRVKPLKAKSTGKGKHKAGGDQKMEFKVGDTVLVVTDLRKTSVAVVTAMWEVIGGEPNESDREDEDGEKGKKMRVRVHWFVKPTQLPSVRVKRDHFENEVYFSLSSTSVVSTSVIVSHCTISTSPPTRKDDVRVIRGDSVWAGTSTPASPTKAGRTADESDDSDESVKEPAAKRRKISTGRTTGGKDGHGDGETFYCRLLVNNQKGLFYRFDWKRHWEIALQSRPSRSDSRFGLGKEWEVQVQDMNLEALDQKTGGGRGGASATGRQKLDQIREEGEGLVSGSEEEDDSADEYKDKHGEDNLSDQSSLAPDASDDDQPAEEEDEDVDASDRIPKTPTKKRKRTAPSPATSRPRSPRKKPVATPASTPRKPKRTAIAQPTPHSKAAIRARARKTRAPPRRLPGLSLDLLLSGDVGKGGKKLKLPDDPWLRAMHVLHVASRPEALPCRDEEYGKVMRAVEELIEEGSGGCVYISGVPGTGKTATVHAVVRELKRMAENNETNPFTYVEINGLRIPEPSAAYSLLWEAVSGHDVAEEGHLKISSKEALKNLTRHFGSGGRRGPGGHACVVLMDELDQLMTTKQDVVYNFFNWPTLVGSKLVVLAVANTMDLPERVMTGRVRSRLGMIRINFSPYTTPQLVEILSSRLATSREGLKADAPQVIAADSLKLAAMKVSSISGDARRVLDICRRTVELVMPLKRAAKPGDVTEVIKVMQNSPTAAYLRDCSFHERLMLASLLKCVKREGVEEIKWGEIQRQHWMYIGVLAGDEDSERKPTTRELGCVLDSLLASRALLIEEGATAAKKPSDDRKVVLNLEQTEVERVLSEVGGQRWKNALSVS